MIAEDSDGWSNIMKLWCTSDRNERSNTIKLLQSTNPILDVVGAPPEMGPITKEPGNERIRTE